MLKRVLLTEEQVKLLERTKQEKKVHGEIGDPASRLFRCAGYLLCGTYQRSWAIYRQTFIDTYSRGVHKTLHGKTAITAADVLNDTVLPWFDAQQISLLHILTDREQSIVESQSIMRINYI